MSRHYTRDLFIGTTLLAVIGYVAVALTPLIQDTVRLNTVAGYSIESDTNVVVTQHEIDEAIRLTKEAE